MIRFYGPVEWNNTYHAFTLDRRASGTSTWFSVSCTAFKECDLAGNGVRNVTFNNSYTFQHGFEYRLKPVLSGNGVVTCDLGSGGPVQEVANSEYWFKVVNPCPADFNCDGCVNGADLSVLLSNFDDTNAGCGQPADANSDDACNGADLSVLLANFGTDCVEECEGGEGFARGGESSIGLLAINAFGHDDFNEYATWVDSMDAEEFADHAQVLQAVLEELLSDE